MNVVYMRDKDILEERKKAREAITKPDAEYNTATNDRTAPAAYFIGPSRAIADARFRNHSSTFLMLCALALYANKAGTLFPNQKTIAELLGKTQQAVSRQMKLLEEWGYIKKIRQQNRLRKVGRKGATWRIVYDPGVSDEELASKMIGEVEYLEQQEASETIKKLSTVAQRQVVKPTVKRTKKDDSNTTSRGCINKQQREVVSNEPLNGNDYSKEISYEMVKWYMQSLDQLIGSRGNWRWDDRQQPICDDIARTGVSLDQWKREITRSLLYHKKEGKRPPYSLAFYKDAFNNKKTKSNDVSQIIKRTVSKTKMR